MFIAINSTDQRQVFGRLPFVVLLLALSLQVFNTWVASLSLQQPGELETASFETFASFRTITTFDLLSENASSACAQSVAGITDVEEVPFLVVLGIAQDGGFPQAGCRKRCCVDVPEERKVGPTCLAIVDPVSKQRWLLECTPDFPNQLRLLDEVFPVQAAPGIDGVFLTHAHIGHYAGLIHFGREVMGTQSIPVFAMPRMAGFLTNNGPWSQLVKLNNIAVKRLADGQQVVLNERIAVTPIVVPHRDEFSETVAFKIQGPKRTALFLPDIDKWERWETSIEELIPQVDVAYLDATFYDGQELPGRDMSQIPHPFIVESIQRFGGLSEEHRNKIRFIHLNHTNPALDQDSPASAAIRKSGMSVAEMQQRFDL